MKMLIKHIGQLFEKSIGLEVTTIPESVWVIFMQERMIACGIDDAEKYLDLLKRSKKEFDELLELIIVPETWFFREKEGIDFLKDHIRKMTVKKNKVVNILSLPCSSGEEPYSIAMALLDNRIPVNSFQINAMDISKKAIAKAEKGVYGKNSFREKDFFFRDRYFEKTENGEYSLRTDVRQCVHFFYANLFDSRFAFNYQYDIIFFRNLLIYLNPAAQKRAFYIIKRLLAPNGILFVGPAEIEIAKKMQFSPIAQGSVYALMRNKESLSTIFEHMQENPVFFQVEENTFYTGDQEERKLFHEAKHLADIGRFDRAQALCLKYIQDHSSDPEGYFLMGLIQHAMGLKNVAEEYFLKTVYLNPDHLEALIYLSLLYENKGDSNKASLYQERAESVQKYIGNDHG